MVIIGIAVLALLVVHAAGKVTVAADATLAAGGNPNALPPQTSVAATGNSQSPSPATWGGAPGAASSWAVKVNTNAPAVTVSSTGLGGPSMPGMPGVPVALVKRQAFNGFDSVPASTKQLSVNRLPSRSLNTSNHGGNKL